MNRWQIDCKDVLVWCKEYTGPQFHSLLADPPYSLHFMNKKWDDDIAFRPETWAALSEHLLPGAFGMAFASSRGWHRLACAIEDAGLRIHPSIFVWSFGSGFPKSTRINRDDNGHTEWEGHRYGLQALKPASEPLITFTKPLTVNPFCGIMTEITFQMEVLSCILLSAQGAESLTNHLHQHLRAGVDNSAQKNAGDWESLETVTIAGDLTASNLAGLTMRDFVVGPAPTPDVMRQLVSTLGIGEMDSLLAKDTATSEQIRDTLQSIVWLWSECLDGLSGVKSTHTTKMEIVLTTDLKTLRSCLQQTIYDAIIHANEPSGLQSLATIAESLLRNVLTKLLLLPGTIATESVSQRLAEQETDQEERKKAGASPQSLNPVIMFQKPYEGRPVDSIVETGAGALFIDGGRVGANELDMQRRRGTTPGHSMFGMNAPNYGNAAGRWPPNFCLVHVPPHLCATCDGDGCDACGGTGLVGGCRRVGTKRVKGTGVAIRRNLPDEGANQQIDIKARTQCGPDATYADADGTEEVAAWDCVESCAARRIGEQSGERKSGARNGQHIANWHDGNEHRYKANDTGNRFEGSTGTAARFFPQFGWEAEIAERLAVADQVFYASKASRGEREAGLENLPLHGPNEVYGDGMSTATKCDPELHTPEGVSKRPGRRNNHPCIKNISLCRWLATLLLPPPEYAPRRILVPFAGVASEMIAASLAGWEFVHGIEMSEEYCTIGEARLSWWLRQLRLPGMEGV